MDNIKRNGQKLVRQNMNSASLYTVPFWQTLIGKLIRWIAFLPFAFLSVSFAEIIPIWATHTANQIEVSSLLGYLVVAFSILFGVPIIISYIFAVYALPRIACYHICPNHKIGAIIFGVLFVQVQAIGFYSIWVYGPFLLGIFKACFSFVILAGVISAYLNKK